MLINLYSAKKWKFIFNIMDVNLDRLNKLRNTSNIFPFARKIHFHLK